MEKVGAFDAKTRLSELLKRTAKGESFTITRHGQPVARLVPAKAHDRARARDAAMRLRQMRGTVAGVSTEELMADIHDGHRY